MAATRKPRKSEHTAGTVTARTTRKPRKTAPRKVTRKAADTTPADRAADTVTVKVRAPHAVYWNGQQQGGTIRGVDKHTAQEWARNGWADIDD